jgi:hypothetical protein
MYSVTNHPTKKSFREAVARDNSGERIFQPNDMFDNVKGHTDYTGIAAVEGPHYPKAHSWYAEVHVVDGIVVKVK